MPKELHWCAKRNMKNKSLKEFHNKLGEKVEQIELKEFYEMYETVKECADKTLKVVGQGCLEKEYEGHMCFELHDRDFNINEQTCEYYEDCGMQKRIVMDITDFEEENAKFVFEIKRGFKKKGLEQLLKYVKIIDAAVGYLIFFVKKKVYVYSVLNIPDGIFWYDGVNTYKKDNAPDGAVLDLAE